MPISVTVMPIIFGMLTQVPPDAPAAAAPASAFVTLALVVGIVMRGRGFLRLWAPVIGVAGGCIVAGFFGLYDLTRVIGAPWFGIPTEGFGGWDLRFGPAFVFVTVVGAIETVGDGVAIQRVSWRNDRAGDYRAVEGAVNADGLGNLFSGLLGTIPNTTYSTSVAMAELTGVGARVVGVYIGALFLAFAFLPKIPAVLLAIPGPVAGAYIMVLLSMLFVLGMKIVVQDGVDYKKGAIVGVSFWIGIGFQYQLIFANRLGEWWGARLGNGMTAGGYRAFFGAGPDRRQTGAHGGGVERGGVARNPDVPAKRIPSRGVG